MGARLHGFRQWVAFTRSGILSRSEELWCKVPGTYPQNVSENIFLPSEQEKESGEEMKDQ
jgi:hypothetical protein